MNNSIRRNINLSCENHYPTEEDRVADLASFFWWLSRDKNFEFTMVENWVMGRPCLVPNRKTGLFLERLVKLVENGMCTTSFTRFDFVCVEYFYSRLHFEPGELGEGKTPWPSYEVYSYIHKAVQYILNTFSGAEAGARIFAAVSYLNELGVDGVVTAGLCTEFYWLMNNIGEFTNSGVYCSIKEALIIWKASDGNILNKEANELVRIIMEDCLLPIDRRKTYE